MSKLIFLEDYSVKWKETFQHLLERHELLGFQLSPKLEMYLSLLRGDFVNVASSIKSRDYIGFTPYFHLIKAILPLHLDNMELLQHRMNAAQQVLEHYPWKREQAFFSILKGLQDAYQGKRSAARQQIDHGLHPLTDERFILNYVVHLHSVVFYLKKKGSELTSEYVSLWHQVCRQYQLKESYQQLQQQFKPFICTEK
jgi:hypothetical protein